MSAPPSSLELRADPSVDVLLVYAVVFIVTIAGAKMISTLLVTMFDRRALGRASEAATSRRNAQTYAIGHLPRAREVFAVAYLRSGVEAVARVVVAEATATGWLVFSDERGHVGHLPRDADDASRALHRALDHGVVTHDRSFAAAKKIALSLEPAIVSDLESAGLLRTWTSRRLGELAALVLAIPSGILGVRRVLEGAEAVGIGSTTGALGGALLFLALEVAGFVVAMFAFARVSHAMEHAGAYLSWLDDATLSLREDVASGRDHRVADVMLATALGTEPWSSETRRGMVVEHVGGGGGCGSSACGSGGGCGS